MLSPLCRESSRAVDHGENIEHCRSTAMQDRLTEIEIKIAHLEDSLTQLSDVIYEQRNLLDKLQQDLHNLRDKVTAGNDGAAPEDPASERPPHY